MQTTTVLEEGMNKGAGAVRGRRNSCKCRKERDGTKKEPRN